MLYKTPIHVLVCKVGRKTMALHRGQNRYSDFVALETLLRFENCSSSHCLLSSWRRFHVFESSHPSFHRTVFFGAPLAFLRGFAMGLCRRCVIFMSSCRRVFLSSTALHTWAGNWCMGTHFVLLLCYPVTLLPFYSVTLLLCPLVILSLCYPVTLFPCSLVTLLSVFFNFSVFAHDKSQFFFPYRRAFLRSWLNGLHYKSVFVQGIY